MKRQGGKGTEGEIETVEEAGRERDRGRDRDC